MTVGAGPQREDADIESSSAMYAVVLPVLNEREAIPWVLERMPAGYQPIVVDNRSDEYYRTKTEVFNALIDTIDLSGFDVPQFIDLHPGAFSSIGGGLPDADAANAYLDNLSAISGEDWGSYDPALWGAVMASFQSANADAIAGDQFFLNMPSVNGIATTQYENVAIAYGTIIENATGGSARDLIHGNAVDNILKGLGGNDVIRGFEGNDTIIGGAGQDVMLGGLGSDTFVFDVAEQGDRIDDFTLQDFIDLGPLDVDLSFIGDSAFSAGGSGEIRYDGGLLSADFDGNGSIDFSVTLTGAPQIHADQILGI